MPLNPLNPHYSIEAPASIYDEEAMTALQLAGRTAAKVNEAVAAFNALEAETGTHLNQQDEAITKMNNETMPAKVTAEVQRKIDSGEFDGAINQYAGGLESRVNNLLGSVTEGATTMDAEVIDMRVNSDGSSFVAAGEATRSAFENIHDMLESNGISKNIKLNLNTGYFISRNGIITAHDNEWGYSEPVAVGRNVRVRLYARGYDTSVAMISRVEPDGTYYPVAKSVNSDMGYYEYVTEYPCELVFSFMYTRGYTLSIAELNVGDTVSGSSLIQKALVNTGVWSVPSYALETGYYIDAHGNHTQNAGYNIAGPIKLCAGHTLLVGAFCHLNNVGVIAEPKQDGYERLVRSSANDAGVSVYNYYTYTADRDMEVVVSFSARWGAEMGILYNPAHAEEKDYVSLSVFKRFGIVGDSYASGTIVETMHYDAGWGANMARANGTECEAFSSGGLTTRSWLTHSKGLNLLNASDPCDIYYLALGINDSNNLGLDYLGTTADIANKADTFCGNYGKIINAIKAHAPKAKIVMFTLTENSDVRTAYNNTIMEIANYFGVPYIVQDSDAFFTSSFYTDTKKSGHPIAITYSGMAKAYERLIKKCVVGHSQYFSDLYET